MRQGEVLVREAGPVDGLSARARAVGEVASLDHKAGVFFFSLFFLGFFMSFYVVPQSCSLLSSLSPFLSPRLSFLLTWG